MRVFLDTNVLVYRFDRTDPARQRTAAALLAREDVDFVVSTQVLIELFAVLTGKFAVPRADATRVLRELDLPVVVTDRTFVLDAAATATSHQLPIFDALILQAAAQSDCAELWSEDFSSGSELRGVRIVNPFSDQPSS
ncbi:MAG: PIN domain-containing protein [Micrococcales bacterium]|nr:PIN domain-containing protein [Micrococcales bacterium]